MKQLMKELVIAFLTCILLWWILGFFVVIVPVTIISWMVEDLITLSTPGIERQPEYEQIKSVGIDPERF